MSESRSSSNAGCAVGVGNVIAFIISWKLFHTLGWALLAFVFGWIYVIYAAINYLPQIKAMLG